MRKTDAHFQTYSQWAEFLHIHHSPPLCRLAGGEYDLRRRLWTFPLAAQERVAEAMAAVKGVRMRLEPLPDVLKAVIAAAARAPDDSERYAHVPSALETQLMPFQREGVKFALRHGGRVLIGDEMVGAAAAAGAAVVCAVSAD